MYILKSKGKGRIPAHVQIRDESFTLVAYFRLSTLDKSLKSDFYNFDASAKKVIEKMPYGKIVKFETS